MKLDIIHIACIVAIFQVLLMAVVFLTSKKGNRQSNVILGFWLLSFAVLMCSYFFLADGVCHYFEDYHKTIFVINQLSLLMAKDPKTIKSDRTVLECAEAMYEHKLSRLPVIDENSNELIGIVSISDIVSKVLITKKYAKKKW